MADRLDWFFAQLVTASDMDDQSDKIEQADFDLAIDYDLACADASLTDGGIVYGSNPSAGSGYDTNVPITTAYDNSGRRIRIGSAQTVNISQTGTCSIGQGGTPTGGSSTSVSAGQERYVSIFVAFQRLLSDPRVDGLGSTVYFDRAESFQFTVTMGSAAPTGTAVEPPMESGKILLCDVLRNDTSIVSVSTSRRQDWFVREGASYPVQTQREQTPRAVLENLLGFYNNHTRNTSGLTDTHNAHAIAYSAAGPAWADASTNPAKAAGANTTDGVQGQIDKIITDLAGTTDPAGAKKIGGRAQTGTGLNTVTTVTSLTATHLDAQLLVLLDAINGRVRRGGDSMGGNLTTDGTTRDLGATGAAGNRFNIYGNNLDVLAVAANLPTDGTTRDIGATGAATGRFNVFANNLDILGTYTTAAAARLIGDIIPNTDNSSDLGSASLRYAEGHIRQALIGVGPSATTVPLVARTDTDTIDLAQWQERVAGGVAAFVDDLGVSRRRYRGFVHDFSVGNLEARLAEVYGDGTNAGQLFSFTITGDATRTIASNTTDKGALEVKTGTSIGQAGELVSATETIAEGRRFRMLARVRLGLTTDFYCRIGVASDALDAALTGSEWGAYFYADNTGGQWVGHAKANGAGSEETTGNLGAVSTNYVELEIRVQSTSIVDFYVNGTRTRKTLTTAFGSSSNMGGFHGYIEIRNTTGQKSLFLEHLEVWDEKY